MNIGIRTGEAFEVGRVTGHDHAAAGLDGSCHRVCVGKIARAGSRCREDTADEASKCPVRVTNENGRLTAEARIDDLVVARATVELGEDDGGRHDLASKPSCGLQSCPNFAEARAALSREDGQRLGIEDQDETQPSRSTYF